MGQLGLARRTKLTSLSEILARDDKPDEGKRHRAMKGNERNELLMPGAVASVATTATI